MTFTTYSSYHGRDLGEALKFYYPELTSEQRAVVLKDQNPETSSYRRAVWLDRRIKAVKEET